MSIVVTSNAAAQEQSPVAQGDKADVVEAAKDSKSSVEAQGEEKEKLVDEESASKEGEESQEGDEQLVDDKPKKKSGIQRLKERHARELAEIRKEIESLKTQDLKSQRKEEISTEKNEAQDSADGEPSEDDFETHKDYVKALAKWTYAQEKAQDEQKSKEAQARNAFESQRKTHNDRVNKFREVVPEYDQVVEDFIEENGDVRFSLGLQQAIYDSEDGPAILLELMKTPGELMRVNALSAFAVAREIGRIEARLSKPVETKIETKQTTKAPPPPTPLGGKSDKATKKSIYDSGLTQSEYESLRRQQMKKSWGA